MPFFPLDWSKHANYVYENRPEELLKKPNDEEDLDPKWFKNFSSPPKREQQIADDRPTSGKHYARKNEDTNFESKRYLGDLPTTDPMVSDLAQNYGATKKVQSLLDKLADYMGGNFDKT